MTKNCIFVHMMDKAAETGDVKRMNFLHVWPPQITTAFLMTIPVALVVYFGADVAKTAIDSLSGMPLHMLEVIGGVLPAVGIGMTLRYSILSAGFPDGDLSGILNDRCSIVCNHHCLFLYGSIFKKDR